MEISIKPEELKTKSIFLATPMYGGQCFGMYMKSCLDLQAVCMQYGVRINFSFLFNESLITRARNYLADEFLRSECTHMLFIDSDIGFNPKDVLALLALDKEVIGAPYPKKAINWRSIKKAILKNPEIDLGVLPQLAGDYVFNPVKGTERFTVTEPMEVMELGTGFMMIKREVFTQIKESYPQLHYKPDHVGQANFDGTRYIHAYFDTVVDSEDSIIGDGSMRYLSEDYFFVRLYRKLGGKIWMCPWMRTTHNGTLSFQGDMPAIAAHLGEL